MPIADNRDQGGGGGGGITSVNGQTGPTVTITAASLGAESAPVSQGSAASPMAIDNSSLVALDTTKNETIYVEGNGADANIDLSNFSGIKPDSKKLYIVVKGIYALTFIPGGIFKMNGNRRMIADSILEFLSDGTNYTEDGGNEIS